MRSIGRRLAGLVLVLAQGPGLATAAAGLLQIDHRWPDLLVQFTAPTLAASLAGTAVAAILRLRIATWVGAGATGMLFCALWPQLAPPARAWPADGETVRVYSANLWARNTDVAAVSRSIREAEADILILVEVGEAPAAELDRLLADYPHRVRRGSQGRRARPAQLVIASRWPLDGAGHDASNVISWARARTPIGPIEIVGVHLTRPWPFFPQEAQLQQAEALVGRRERFENPVILAGDFNSVSSGRIGRRMQSMDLIPAPGWPGTWPATLPAPLRMTIDQVYHSPELALVSRRLGAATGSDHRPVIIDFARALPIRAESAFPRVRSQENPPRSTPPRTP